MKHCADLTLDHFLRYDLSQALLAEILIAVTMTLPVSDQAARSIRILNESSLVSHSFEKCATAVEGDT